jgi:hypothetical protein
MDTFITLVTVMILQKNGIGQMLLTSDMSDAVAGEDSVEMDIPKKSKKTKEAPVKEKMN